MSWREKSEWLAQWLATVDEGVADYAMKSAEAWTKPPQRWNIVPEAIDRPLKKLHGDLVVEVFVPVKKELEQCSKSKDDDPDIDGKRKENLKLLVEERLAKAKSIKNEWDAIMPKEKLAIPITPEERSWKQEGYHTHRTIFHYALGQVLDKALALEKETGLIFENKMDESDIWEKGHEGGGLELPS